ncbi:MAG TPA: hypothetical protein VFM90_05015 [Cyclobacteriaceae bacterium]|nr:hypothetical protein [Cyclobacteriaceae bacterium]
MAKTTHYCMGREKSTKVFSFESKKCPCSDFLPEKNDCCADRQELLIVDDFQTQTLSLSSPTPDFFPIGETYQKQPEFIFAYASTQYSNSDFSPPPKEPLFKINCSFVFYDDGLS